MFDELLAVMKSRLLTGEEFNQLLNEALTKEFQENIKLQYVLSDKDGNEYKYGETGSGEFTISQTHDFEDGYKLKVYIWQSSSLLNGEQCKKIFDEFWNLEFCDNTCGLPMTDKEVLLNKCNNTIKTWQNENKSIAVVMMDLDHFKEVNTKHNHAIGTAVISEFSRILFNKTEGSGILLHQSGDEFNLLFTYEEYTQVLDLLYSVYKETRGHVYKDAEDVDLTMAIGVWLLDNSIDFDFRTIRVQAENIYDPKQRNSDKQRNSIRIGKQDNRVTHGKNDIKLGLIRVIGNSYNSQLFHNIYLDYLANLVSEIQEITEIENELNIFLEWINPEQDSEIRVTSHVEKCDVVASVSEVDMALAVLHGLFRNNNLQNNKLLFQIKDSEVSVRVGERDIIRKSIAQDVKEIMWQSSEISSIRSDVDIRKVTLVKAGYANEQDLPEDIFNEVVCVDARPSIGGGLPDFWAATLAALITNMKKNPNFESIIIHGDVENIKKVKEFLENIQMWNEKKMKYISKKTYSSYSDVLEFQKKFSRKIYVCMNESQVIEKYFSLYENLVFVNRVITNDLKQNVRFMKRMVSYESIQLGICDGCRTNTISQAFPTVLEILRNSNGNKLIDQAGRELVELTDFKIVLQKPLVDKLPEYYHYDEKELDEYYKTILMNEDGLFRERLNMDSQLESLINHVMTVIDSEQQYSTRRAILVVPNVIKDVNYSPLGLVSIWLAPRFFDGKIKIDYSYTWRTVEAIVGLPLSMYASVRFAEYITNRILEKINDGNYSVEMGTVTYIAHSLHMFTDEESRNIVRGIVNEVSQ